MKVHFIELLGPAGAGKTTLVKSLIQSGHNMSLARKPSLRSINDLPFYLKNFVALQPILSQQRPGDRKLSNRELAWMLFLNGWDRVMARRAMGQAGLKLLDHGPIYMLASLYAFGPPVTQTIQFQNWWHLTLRKWSQFLSWVIWLDAPNEILAARINQRVTDHPVKGQVDLEVYEFLDRYRQAFEQVISKMSAFESKIKTTGFQTDRETPDAIQKKVLEIVQDQFIS